METQIPVELTASLTKTTQLNIISVTADLINVEYKTMPGNQPSTYGNFLAIWQNSSTIPWNTDPIKTFPIPTNSPSGSAAFTGLTVGALEYVIGYAVGPTLIQTGNVQRYGNVCSTASIQGPKDPASIFTPSITGVQAGPTSLSFDFNLPDGLLPQTNGAWAALWRGENPNYYGVAPLNSVQITPDASFGTCAFNNVALGSGLTYTIAIFMSGYLSSTQKTCACSATFIAP